VSINSRKFGQSAVIKDNRKILSQAGSISLLMKAGAVSSDRAGTYVRQSSGYDAFIPVPLQPPPRIVYDGELQTLLSDADRDLGRLDAIAALLPNPDLFVAMYVRHEAVLSSQIEGTESTLEDVLAFEARAAMDDQNRDVAEVVNYVAAMNHGLRRLPDFPLSLRLIKEIHGELMRDVRGGDKTPGEFRSSQNWIGGQGCTLKTASFVPPPPHEVMESLGSLEKFIHEARESVPLLIRCGLAHAQFETIHPFLDGNGRVGRLLITLMLCEARALTRPLLYLSVYLKAHRAEYYDRLTAVRHHGHWEPWLKFFLRGVSSTARAATQTARDIVTLRDQHRSEAGSNAKAWTLLDGLYRYPVVSINRVREILGCTYPTASKHVREFEQRGWLKEMTGHERNRLYRYEPYLNLFHREAFETSFAR
jgi:Fic family protein